MQYEYAGGIVKRWACVLKTGEVLFPSFTYHPAALRRRDMAAAAMPTLLDVASFASNSSINSAQHAAVGDRHGFGGMLVQADAAGRSSTLVHPPEQPCLACVACPPLSLSGSSGVGDQGHRPQDLPQMASSMGCVLSCCCSCVPRLSCCLSPPCICLHLLG